uniref:F-box protein n=1 Tax=Kalanchoe fedtschenkoi TaxID=63787 RepID=A0A7N0T475_KALFE
MEMDFLKLLDADAAIMIFNRLDAPADLVRASLVSHAWQDFVIDRGLGKQLGLKKYPQLSCIARVAMVNGKEMPSDVGSSSSMEWERRKRDQIVYTSLAHLLDLATKWSCIVEAISASSTDNHPEESIDNTLIQSDRVEQRASYWSSKGQSNPDVPERLIYKLKSSLCLINEVYIQPFQAYFQLGYPIYSSRSVRFRMGYPKFPLDFDLEDVRLMEFTDQDFVWNYTSPEFPMSQERSLQKFQLPEPALCIGGFLLIELLGRVQRQEMDYLFYICVSHVRADGMSLSPKFTATPLQNSGSFVLEYNPHASIDSPNGVCTSIIEVRDEEPPGHQNWGQFMNMQLMHMLQPYVPGYPNHGEAEDDEDEDEIEILDEDGAEDIVEDGEFI